MVFERRSATNPKLKLGENEKESDQNWKHSRLIPESAAMLAHF